MAWFKYLSAYLAGISYPIFLIHHQIIYKMYWIGDQPGNYGSIFLIVATIILTIVFSDILNRLLDKNNKKLLIRINVDTQATTMTEESNKREH